MYKSVVSQPKSVVTIESPYSSINGPFCIFVCFSLVRPGFFCMPVEFFGLKVTLRFDRRARYSARRLSCFFFFFFFCHLAIWPWVLLLPFPPRLEVKYMLSWGGYALSAWRLCAIMQGYLLAGLWRKSWQCDQTKLLTVIGLCNPLLPCLLSNSLTPEAWPPSSLSSSRASFDFRYPRSQS